MAASDLPSGGPAFCHGWSGREGLSPAREHLPVVLRMRGLRRTLYHSQTVPVHKILWNLLKLAYSLIPLSSDTAMQGVMAAGESPGSLGVLQGKLAFRDYNESEQGCEVRPLSFTQKDLATFSSILWGFGS